MCFLTLAEFPWGGSRLGAVGGLLLRRGAMDGACLAMALPLPSVEVGDFKRPCVMPSQQPAFLDDIAP